MEEAEMKGHEELIELQNNEELKPKFKKGYHHFWSQQQVAQLQPHLWTVVDKLLTGFHRHT
ncbi:hypothetical protein M514_00864 [Trichuris suis]|uniref:Uncharacterized protein n=1 Tax=Trichuris suis TaxID=68888 RepID=A0A085MLK5_9BILA|nr:hypothetical protein M513_00864 [Trichuris suis]KFD59292.1 hypothetical protein M514_00864 [Trichuris suis]